LNKWEIIKKTVSVCLLLSITFSIFINSDVVLALSQKVENINFGENINFYGVVQDSAIRLVTPTVDVEPTPIGSLTPAVTETPLATPTQETLPSPSPSEFSTPTPSFTPDASPESTSTPFPSPLPFPMPDSTSTPTPDPDSTSTPTPTPTPIPTPSVSPSPSDTEAPSRPECLVTTDRTDTMISLSWSASTDNVGVKGYYIYRDGVKLDVSVTEPCFTDEGLTENTTYRYYVTAYDEAGNESERSTELVVMTLANNITS